MTALETITEKAREKGLRFLVIGGHALMAHGFARSTFDLDLMIPAAEREGGENVDDVLNLVKENKLDVLDGEFKALILKHGTPEVYEKLKRVFSK